MPPLIDSLIITSANEEDFEIAVNSRDDSDQQEDVLRSSTGKNESQLHRPSPVLGNTLSSRSDSRVSQSILGGLDDSHCPKIYCFIHHYYSASKLILDCREDEPVNRTVVEQIDCLYRMSPTSPSVTPKASQRVRPNSGRGYDLKITLIPSQGRRFGSAERRVTVDYLTNGVLGWVVETVRQQLHMLHSPVHLTLPFIQFAHIRRADVGDLSAKYRVTRLSMWNPFQWDDDSLIPIPSGPNFASYVSPRNPSVPPYFRLNVFCDHINRKPSFKRLWLPWESWQVRFYHCQGKYGCLAWLSPYSICDSSTHHSFMPSFLIMPLLASSPTASRSIGNAPGEVALKYKPENEILFETQCRKEPTEWDPLDDLAVDQSLGCWGPNMAVDLSRNTEEPSSVLLLENRVVASEENTTQTTPLSTSKLTSPSSSNYSTTTKEFTTAFIAETSAPTKSAANEILNLLVVKENQTVFSTPASQTQTNSTSALTVSNSFDESAGRSGETLDSMTNLLISTETEPTSVRRTDELDNASLPWFMQPFVKHYVSSGPGGDSSKTSVSPKESDRQVNSEDAVYVRNLYNAVIFLSALVILLLALLTVLLILFQVRHGEKRRQNLKTLRGFSLSSQPDRSGYNSAKLSRLKYPFVPVISEPILTGDRATVSAFVDNTCASATSLTYDREPRRGAPNLLTFGAPRNMCMENEAYSCATERRMMNGDTGSTSTIKSHPCMLYDRSLYHTCQDLPPPIPNGHNQGFERGQIFQPLRTKLKSATKKTSKKKHTLVFEDGELSQDKIPEGLRRSYSLINPSGAESESRK